MTGPDLGGHHREIPGLADLLWPRHTRRLRLRPPEPTDARAVYELQRPVEVWQWLSRRPGGWPEFRTRFAEQCPERLVIELGDQIIGVAKVCIQDGWAPEDVAEQARNTQAELGWYLHPDHFGRGYATEAARELLGICFQGLGLRRVHAGCYADNVASWRVMEKIGMRREGYFVRESLHRDGSWRDGLEYALLADEWDPEPTGGV